MNANQALGAGILVMGAVIGGLYFGWNGGEVIPREQPEEARFARLSTACPKPPLQVSCFIPLSTGSHLYATGICDKACAGPETATQDGKTLPLQKKDCTDPLRPPYDAVLAKCTKGIVEGEGWCGCLTTSKASEPVADEVGSADSLPPEKLHKMIVCPMTETGGGVSYPLASAPLPEDCQEVLPKVLMPGVGTNSLSTDIEAKLAAKCAPCAISPGSWGPCPHCLLWPGGCTAACVEK